jgi:hypothetical protein
MLHVRGRPARQHGVAACEVGTRAARFSGHPWGDDDEPVPSGSTTRSQTWNQGKGTVQEKARLRVGSRWVGSVVVADLTKIAAPGRRTRRRFAPCAAPVFRPTWTSSSSSGDRSGSTCSRSAPSSGALAATRHPALPSLPPLFPSPAAAHTRKGKTPSGLVWRG